MGATIVVMLAIYGAMHIAVVRIRPTSIDPAVAAMIGVIAGMSISGVVLCVLTRRRPHAVLFALHLPGLLLVPFPRRDPARSEWPITLVVTMVAGKVMVWRARSIARGDRGGRHYTVMRRGRTHDRPSKALDRIQGWYTRTDPHTVFASNLNQDESTCACKSSGSANPG